MAKITFTKSLNDTGYSATTKHAAYFIERTKGGRFLLHWKLVHGSDETAVSAGSLAWCKEQAETIEENAIEAEKAAAPVAAPATTPAPKATEPASAYCPACGFAGESVPCPVCGHGSVPTAPAPKSPAPVAPAPVPTATAALLNQLNAPAPAPVVRGSVPPHVIVTARAGTGKTTTLLQGLKQLRGGNPRELVSNGQVKTIEPSVQQAAVWNAIAQSKDARTVCFCAFNRSIAAELKAKVPPGCEAKTMHGMGFGAVNRAFKLLGGDRSVNEYRVDNIIEEILGVEIRDLRRTKPVVLKATKDLVGHVKSNLVPVDISDEEDRLNVEELLTDLAHHYGVELEDDNGKSFRAEVYDLIPKVIARCADVAKDGYIDYDDMVWLPVFLDLPVFMFDLLLVDEAQDLNRCQQALAKKAGRRLILCGDDRQAIYGFAGADAESLPRMKSELGNTPRGCVELPLTVTRRCGKAIVTEARKIVPDFDAFETNGVGSISTAVYASPVGVPTVTYHARVEDGDMILCRVNAPLVSQCFHFLRAGRKANIQGRDVGAKLIRTINQVTPKNADRFDVPALIGRIDDWRRNEERKENAKRNPNENWMIQLNDTADCLMMFCDGMASVDAVITRIQTIFTDDKTSPGIKLSSVHKAKGLEAKRVFLLRPKGAEMPHPMAKQPWAIHQEWNLLYVAITRAIEELVMVS